MKYLQSSYYIPVNYSALACVAGVKRERGRGNLGARELVGRGRSLKFSSSFPAISVLLCAPLDPIRPDKKFKECETEE